jgi:hypothetical protein
MRSLPLMLLAGCSFDPPVLLDVPLSVMWLSEPTWMTEDGHTVTVIDATLPIADVRLESPAEEVAWNFSLLPTAYAHPGHDFAGSVAGEWLGEGALVLGGDEEPGVAQELGIASCYTGDYATGRFQLRGDYVIVGTVALAGGGEVLFRFTAPIDRLVSGVPFVARLAEEPAPRGVQLGVYTSLLLRWVDWSTDPVDGELTLEDGALGNSVPFGLTSSASWMFTLDETP